MGYKTIKDGSAQDTILKSRFLAFAYRIDSEEDAKEKVKFLRKKYYDSTHICYAFCLRPDENILRFSDDGEPCGTAGLPILEVIKGNKIFSVLIAVVRYFGGIKLGTGGLVSAYGNIAAESLTVAEKVTIECCNIYEVILDYNTYKKIEKNIKHLTDKIINISFGTDIQITCAVIAEKDTLINQITQLSQGKSKIKLLDKQFYEF